MSRKDRRHDPEAAERVTSIIEAAERAAAALIDKADANAKRYLAEAEAEADRAAAARLQALNETAEALISQAEEIRRESARLLESLRHADLNGRQGGVQPGGAGPAAPDPRLQARPEQELGPDPQARPEQPPAQGDAGGSRGKHLAAVPGPNPAATPDPWPGRPPYADPPPGAGAGPAPTYAAPVSQDAPGPMPPQGDPQRPDGASGARLLATQMAVSGYSRREIEAKLRRGFRIEDPTAILDAILGPGD